MPMDKKTVLGFVMLGISFAFKIVAKYYGIDGVVDDAMNGLMATALFLIAGIQLQQYKKEGS